MRTCLPWYSISPTKPISTDYAMFQGLSQTAIEAAAKAEQEHDTINVIEQTEDTYKIRRRSRMIDATKIYKIGQETTETAKSGNKKVLVTADTNCVRTVTSMPSDRQLIDTRRLADSGAVMTFSIELLTPAGKVSLMRYFDRQQPKPINLLVDAEGELPTLTVPGIVTQ